MYIECNEITRVDATLTVKAEEILEQAYNVLQEITDEMDNHGLYLASLGGCGHISYEELNDCIETIGNMKYMVALTDAE